MKKVYAIFVFMLMFILAYDDSVAQQLNINRIEQMPNQPSPYEMRDWKQVTLGYDTLVFDFNREGEYLPLISWMTNTINYPNHESFRLHTVVGTPYPLSSEAINVIPAVIGASLAGIDKSTQNGYNWVLFCEEFFNKRPEENVYLNHPVAQSGDDWWYSTMPNIFFYQLYDLYPQTGDFSYQFTSVANQWLHAVETMGGSATPWHLPDMDHRGWYLSSMTPYDDDVHQPEAAGAIGWLLYHAYRETGQEKYRMGAEWALEFLSNWPTNPSYELQLSYGTYIAARMNAELGTQYDIEKIINWCFDVGPLRNWGAVLDEWGVYDVYGLIGEADGSSDYAFVMNTFEQIGALVPLVRYDDRFARAIGKWVLNAANACRLFYPNYLSDLRQDSEAWAHTYDPKSYIAHEAMRQMNGFPYATGDAIDGGWGATNLTLYGSSHVGILGGIIDTTIVDKILRLDLLKTDYFHDQAYPSYLYYNPYDEEKIIELNTGEGTHDLYNAVTDEKFSTGVSGITTITIPADAAMLVVILPASGVLSYDLDKMLVNDVIVDYRSDQSTLNYPPRIKGLGAASEIVTLNDSTAIFCTSEDKDNDSQNYSWQTDGGMIKGSGPQIQWIAPSVSGDYSIICWVDDNNGGQDSASIHVQAMERINSNPQIQGMHAEPRKIDLGSESTIVCSAYDADGDELAFYWSSEAGSLEVSDSSAVWTAPSIKGDYFIVCRVEDAYGGSAVDSIDVAVRDLSQVEEGDLVAYYPFDGNSNDASTFGNHGTVHGATLTADRFGVMSKAYYFDGQNDYILVPNASNLNFQNSITVNFWIKITEFFDAREAYPLSHGNWERRWKFSIGDRKIRWTVKTESQVKDVDSEYQLKLNTYYNITGLYNGSDFELYINGVLNRFTQLAGQILTTTIDLTIGQMLPDNNQYNFKGVIDDIRIYNYALSMQEIAELYDINLPIAKEPLNPVPATNNLEQNYPNPFNEQTMIRYQIGKPGPVQINVFDILGRKVKNLISTNQTSGYYSIYWDGTNEAGIAVTSGIYLYELRTKNYFNRRKLLMLK